MIELSKAFHLQTSNNNYFKVSTLTFSQLSMIHLTIKFLEDPFTMHINIQSKAHCRWQLFTIFMDFLLTKLMDSKLFILHKSMVIKNKQPVTLLFQINTAVLSNFFIYFRIYGGIQNIHLNCIYQDVVNFMQAQGWLDTQLNSHW